MTRKPQRNRQAVSRILEAIIAAVVLLLTFSAAAVMLQTSGTRELQEGGDLNRLGYNVLSIIVESGAVDKTQANLEINTILRTNLPPTIYYNFTVLNCIQTNGIVTIQADLSPKYKNIANANDPATFTNSSQVSSTSTMYTSPDGQIRELVLKLARAGG